MPHYLYELHALYDLYDLHDLYELYEPLVHHCGRLYSDRWVIDGNIKRFLDFRPAWYTMPVVNT